MKNSENNAYKKAKRHIAEIKGFFTHLMIYITGNILYMFFMTGIMDDGMISQYIPKNALLINILVWGLVIGIHALYVFKGGTVRKRYQEWETKKIISFIEKEVNN